MQRDSVTDHPNRDRSHAIETLGIIAGSGLFPFLVARGARREGVRRIVVVAFPGETDAGMGEESDEIHWIGVGQLGKLIRIFQRAAVGHAVLAGRLSPNLPVKKLKLDLRMIALAARVKDRRAETILKAIADEISGEGIELLDSTSFLKDHLPPRGKLTRRRLTRREEEDIEFGVEQARRIARLDIGQTVAVKDRAVVAVEAMEGTDATIRRAGEIAGEGIVVVKVARPDQDMRFDVPVVGLRTVETLREARASVLAVEAGKTLLLDRDSFVRGAEGAGIAVLAV